MISKPTRVQKDVIIETSLFAESLVADGTAKGPILGVFMRVVSQIAGRRKGFGARGTFVGFHLLNMLSTLCHLHNHCKV